MALLLFIFMRMMRMTLGSSKPETVKASKTKPVAWEEVQGVDAAKDELLDVAEWPREPDLAAMRLAREGFRRARALLSANRACLDDLAEQAIVRETPTRQEPDESFARHTMRGLVEQKGSGAALVALSRKRRFTS